MQPTPYCPACGTQNAFGARFCSSCGQPMAAPAQPVQVNVNTSSQRGSWLRTCGIIAIGFVALFVVGTIIIMIVAINSAPSSSGIAESEPKPMLEVSVGTIYRDYLENEARANQEYKDRTLFLRFTVDEIEDRYVVQQLDDFASARLNFPVEVLVEYDVGDSDQRECTLGGFEMDTFLDFNCK